MKLNWLKISILKSVLAVFISGMLMCFLEVPEVVDSFLDYMYLLTLIAFCSGLMSLLIGMWYYFFESSGVPNYIYRPKKRFIFVRYSTCPFQIERMGAKIWVGMVLAAQLRHRQITLHETVSNPRNLFKKDYFMGTAGDDIFVAEDGQKLNLTRGIMGISVSWEEDDNPWKIVVE